MKRVRMDSLHFTPLHCAASTGKLFINSIIPGMDLTNFHNDVGNGRPFFDTRIFLLRKGYIDSAKLLVDNNADLNAKTTDGNTPLILASLDGLYSCTSQGGISKGYSE